MDGNKILIAILEHIFVKLNLLTLKIPLAERLVLNKRLVAELTKQPT